VVVLDKGFFFETSAPNMRRSDGDIQPLQGPRSAGWRECVCACVGVDGVRRDTTDCHRGQVVSDTTQVEAEEDFNGGRWIQQS
jgi:hypothetical protein